MTYMVIFKLMPFYSYSTIWKILMRTQSSFGGWQSRSVDFQVKRIWVGLIFLRLHFIKRSRSDRRSVMSSLMYISEGQPFSRSYIITSLKSGLLNSSSNFSYLSACFSGMFWISDSNLKNFWWNPSTFFLKIAVLKRVFSSTKSD